MRFKSIIVSLCLCLVCFCAAGQEISVQDILDSLQKNQGSIELVNAVSKKTEELKANISNLGKAIASTESEINALEDSMKTENVDKTKDSIYYYAIRSAIDFLNVKCQTTPLEKRRMKQNAQKGQYEDELRILEEKKGFIDTCVLRISVKSLSNPFDKKTMDLVNEEFKKMSPSLQKYVSGIVPLLEGYETYYTEFCRVLSDAQKDEDRTSPFATESYPAKVQNRLKQMPYYKKHYKTTWYIPYLNQMIDKAMAEARKHSKNYRADFTGLLTELGWKEEASM